MIINTDRLFLWVKKYKCNKREINKFNQIIKILGKAKDIR